MIYWRFKARQTIDELKLELFYQRGNLALVAEDSQQDAMNNTMHATTRKGQSYVLHENTKHTTSNHQMSD